MKRKEHVPSYINEASLGVSMEDVIQPKKGPMSNLKTVTITGADDSTSVRQMLEISAEYPFVEWGILVSRRQEGSYRFPSRRWIDELSASAGGLKVALSTHVCGAWVRQMFVGELNWADLPSVIQVCQRVQINTHADSHVSTIDLMRSLGQEPSKMFIFQWDGVNNHLTFAAKAYGVSVAALFDTSGGAGVLPGSWPEATNEFACGYAGGLGPENVVQETRKILNICPKPFWIDMERRVRTEDDSALDMSKVRSVLKSCAAHFF